VAKRQLTLRLLAFPSNHTHINTHTHTHNAANQRYSLALLMAMRCNHRLSTDLRRSNTCLVGCLALLCIVATLQACTPPTTNNLLFLPTTSPSTSSMCRSPLEHVDVAHASAERHSHSIVGRAAYIISFTQYFAQHEINPLLEQVIANSTTVASNRWSIIERSNAASCFPSDFAVIQVYICLTCNLRHRQRF
jgi:hypothetical protein